MEAEEMRKFRKTGIVNPSWMRVIEKNSEAIGVSALMMMEVAGKALAEAVFKFNPLRVLVLCGKGNNGGDGMVAARYMQTNTHVDVMYLDEEPKTEETTLQLKILNNCSISLHPFRCAQDVHNNANLFKKADIIIDALLGTGSVGTPREPLASCISAANNAHVPIIAVDIPTPGIQATRIIAFHRPKVLGSDVVDIGIPLEAECFTGSGDLTLIPKRPDNAHKGVGGEVLVVGGGPYQGAPYLTGIAALRAGADIVRITSPIFLPFPDLIYIPLQGKEILGKHLPILIKHAQKADVVIVGNGLGTKSHDVVVTLGPYCKRLVVDADALRLPLPKGDETIYTPHGGEFTRITGKSVPDNLVDKGQLVKEAASSGVMLLKGPIDIISDGSQVRFNKTGCSSMTVGGTGDVLAGIIGALFCQMEPFAAACVAAYANGLAGEEVQKNRGNGMMASDLFEFIPRILFRGNEQ